MRKLLIAGFFYRAIHISVSASVNRDKESGMEEETLKSVLFFPISFYRNISNLSM